MLSKNLTLLMLDNKSKVVSLMEGLIQMPGHNAQQLLDAIIPLTKVSPTIRDHFILLLRKALYSRFIIQYFYKKQVKKHVFLESQKRDKLL
jgi:hypothetical protein